MCDEQIEEKKEEPKETKEDPVKKQLGLMIKSLPVSLQQQNEFEGFMALKQEKPETDAQPIVLKAADDVGTKNFHLTPNIYPLSDVSLLNRSISNSLLDLPAASPEVLTKIQSLAYEMENFCGQASNSTVCKALRQFAFENFDMTTGRSGISKLRPSEEYFGDIEQLLRPGQVSEQMLNELKNVQISHPHLKLDHYNYKTTYEKDALVQVSF